MNRLHFILILLAVATASCTEDVIEPRETTRDWWPVAIGNRWEYTTTWEDTTGFSELDSIRDVVEFTGVIENPLDVYASTNGGFELGLPNALFFKERRIEDGTGAVWFDLDRIGDTIHVVERSSYREAWVQIRSTLDYQGMMVPVIQLQRVRTVYTDFNYPAHYTLSIWYAKGYGIIRYTGKPLSASTLQIKQLVSYQFAP